MKQTNRLPLATALLIAAIGIGYIQQMAPSPILPILREAYGLQGRDALLNLCVSIVHPMTIVASLLGGVLESRLGVRKLFTWAQVFLTVGVLSNLLASTYGLFLAGRVLFSVGFGLTIPFIGSAIMNWYQERGRERMNTLNGMFPFLGTVISFSVLLPLTRLVGSWKAAMGLWGVPLAVLLGLWVLCVQRGDVPEIAGERAEHGIYRTLWRNRGIRRLCGIFVLDFFCYSYMVVLLPTFLMEAGNLPETQAGLYAALAFPAVGIVGGALGGVLMSATGRRKPILATGQVIKLAGILLLTLGIEHSVWLGLVGTAVFGLGNGMWMPVLYAMPMEMEGMTPGRVGAVFALISSCGFTSGFLSPVLGGILTDVLGARGGHVFGLKWSLFLFGFTNLIAFLLSLGLRETAPASNQRDV